MKKQVQLNLILLCLFLPILSYCQPGRVKAILDTNEIYIGDQINLKISAKDPGNAFLEFSIGNNVQNKNDITIIRSYSDTSYSKGTINKITQNITISAYSPGTYTIQPELTYFYEGDTIFHKITADSILLYVKAIAVDTTKGIKDITAIAPESFHFSEISTYLYICLGIICLALFAFWLLKRYKKDPTSLPFISKPEIPPHVIAEKALKHLKGKALWQNDRIKEYYTELVDIFKIYISNRYSIFAIEMTSDELIDALHLIDRLPEELIKNMEGVLSLSDLVKFAKLNPLPYEHDKCFEYVVNFVKQTADISIKSKEETINNKINS